MLSRRWVICVNLDSRVRKHLMRGDRKRGQWLGGQERCEMLTSGYAVAFDKYTYISCGYFAQDQAGQNSSKDREPSP